LSTIPGHGRGAVGLSYERSISLVRYFHFDFEDVPHTLDLPGGANPVVVEGDNDIFALDDEGFVWELRARDFENKIPSATEFQRMELSAAAADIVTDADFCARLVNGEVWCKSYSQAGSMRLGLGRNAEHGSLTQLPIEGVKDFSMNYFSSCWLDQGGGLYCAGDDVPDSTVSSFDFPTFHWIPNVPPFKRVWMGMFNGCALAEDDWLWCWNAYQLTLAAGREPIPVGYFPGVREVATHANTICVLREDHKVVCQGDAKAYSCSEPDEYGWWTIHFGTCDETGYCCKGESL
jgi:hypothetical protein